jgi:ubiquinol-cytochrome c reductase iron-sulfur subunit
MDSNEKRLLLRATLKLMTAVGVIVLAAVMVSGMFGADDSGSRDTVQHVALGDLPPGELREVTWRGRPVLILHRDAAMLAALAGSTGLRDAEGSWSQQPEGISAQHRSRSEQYFVAFAQGTDLNCALELLPAGGQFRGQPWGGGFKDVCRGSRYDFAGRVFDGQEAQRNLTVPPHRIDGDTLLLGSQ